MAALDSDEDGWVVEALRAAKAWGIPPTTILAGRPKQWNDEDMLLAIALQRYESQRVAPSGYPWRMAGVDDAWEVEDTRTDYALKALHDWRDENKDIGPGVEPVLRYHPTIRPDER